MLLYMLILHFYLELKSYSVRAFIQSLDPALHVEYIFACKLEYKPFYQQIPFTNQSQVYENK